MSSALDQAFIRAYQQPGPAPAQAEAKGRKPAPHRLRVKPAPKPTPESPGKKARGKTLAAARHVAGKPSRKGRSRTADHGIAGPAILTLDAAKPKPKARAPESIDFRPMLEVDRFLWPSVVERLDAATGSPLEPLTDALVRGAAAGWKTVAVAGCHRGDGCTTVTLAAARRLSREGLQLALADGDFERPHLARRLGLSPECGWEEALCGRTALADVAIESLDDRLVLLPVLDPTSCPTPQSKSPWNPAAAMGVLLQRYDLVLLDLGRVGKPDAAGIGPFDPPTPWIDAAVLVHNVRSTSPAELTEAHERLRAAGIADILVVENFV